MGSEYIQLSDLSTLASPVLNTPHFHRTKFAGVHDTELWVILEVALQTVELPTSDYSPVDVQVLRASTDEDGDVVNDHCVMLFSCCHLPNQLDRITDFDQVC